MIWVLKLRFYVLKANYFSALICMLNDYFICISDFRQIAFLIEAIYGIFKYLLHFRTIKLNINSGIFDDVKDMN